MKVLFVIVNMPVALDVETVPEPWGTKGRCSLPEVGSSDVDGCQTDLSKLIANFLASTGAGAILAGSYVMEAT